MKILILSAALLALAAALPAEEPSVKQKRGILGLEHSPALIGGPLLAKSYSTPIIHTAPVVTRVFEAPPVPLINNYAPLITGPLIARGIGPHIYGKSILSGPIYNSAPIYGKPLIASAPILSYGPKLAYGHGW